MKIDVYRNLNSGNFSIMSRERENYGRVVDHANLVVVENAKFVVRPRGREKVRITKTKTVHAFVRGDLVMAKNTAAMTLKDLKAFGLHRVDEMVEVTYNPYKHRTFVTYEEDLVLPIPVYEANKVVLFDNKVYAEGLALGVYDI